MHQTQMHYSVLSFLLSVVGSLGCDLCEEWVFYFLFKNSEIKTEIKRKKSLSLDRLNQFKSEYLLELLF